MLFTNCQYDMTRRGCSEESRTFLNFLFHSCAAMRTLTARDMRPAETTTPTCELEKSLRTMGVAMVDVYVYVVGVVGGEYRSIRSHATGGRQRARQWVGCGYEIESRSEYVRRRMGVSVDRVGSAVAAWGDDYSCVCIRRCA